MKQQTKDVLQTVRRTIIENELYESGDHLILGLSGGPDSLSLFECLMQLGDEIGYDLEVVHVNHGFRGRAADEDQRFCEDICLERGIKCHTFYRDCNKIARETGKTAEEAGRLVRFESFFKVALAIETGGVPKEKIKVVLAQNKNDQAETVLFRIIRGTGIDGLAGMTPSRRTRDGLIITRPLLNVDRVSIEAFCRERDLAPRIDKTNFEGTYTRNKIRRRLIPSIDKDFGTDVTSALVRLSANAAEDRTFLDEEAQKIFSLSLLSRTPSGMSFRRSELAMAPPAMKRRIILMACAKIGLDQDVERTHLLQAEGLIDGDNASGSVDLPAGVKIKVSYDEVEIKKSSKDEDPRMTVLPEISKRIIPIVQFDLKDDSGQFAYFDADKLAEALLGGEKSMEEIYVRTRQEGDFINLNGGRKSIQDLFVDMKVAKADRDTIFMACAGREVLWIPQGKTKARYAEKYKISQDTRRVLILEIAYQL